MTKTPVTFRIEDKLLERLKKASSDSKNPYAPTQVQIVERGIELALKEIEGKKR
jgi:hypothetical protein